MSRTLWGLLALVGTLGYYLFDGQSLQDEVDGLVANWGLGSPPSPEQEPVADPETNGVADIRQVPSRQRKKK